MNISNCLKIQVTACILCFFSLSCYTQVSTDLFKAVKRGKIGKVKQLLENNDIIVDAQDNKNYTPLYYAVNKNNIDIAELLIEHGANINYSCKPCSGAGYLHVAVWNRSAEMAEMLIEKGIKVDKQDSAGETPLHNAVKSDFEDLIKLLLIHGADSDIKDEQGLSAIEWAEKLMQEDNVQLLKEY